MPQSPSAIQGFICIIVAEQQLSFHMGMHRQVHDWLECIV